MGAVSSVFSNKIPHFVEEIPIVFLMFMKKQSINVVYVIIEEQILLVL